MSSSAYAKYEDSTLRKVLGVCLDASQANAGGSPPVLFLAGLVEVGACHRSLLLRVSPRRKSFAATFRQHADAACVRSTFLHSTLQLCSTLGPPCLLITAAYAAPPPPRSPSPVAARFPLPQELRAEAGEAAADPLMLCQDNAERAMMARLRCASAPCYRRRALRRHHVSLPVLYTPDSQGSGSAARRRVCHASRLLRTRRAWAGHH